MKKTAAPWIITAGFLLGLAAICAGFTLLHPAAGLIVGGALTAYSAYQLDRDAAAGKSFDA